MSALEAEHQLEANRVPAAPIVAVVKDYLSRQIDLSDVTDDDRGTSPLNMLAIRCDVLPNTLERVLTGRNNTLDFDFADLLLTKINRVDVWWGELNDIYLEAQLVDEGYRRKPATASGARVCAAPGCNNEFTRSGKGRGGHNKQIYCSPRCNHRAAHIRNGTMRPVSEGRNLVCRNGHPRSKENVQILKNGSRRCRICAIERTQEFRNRKREIAHAD